jgi:hypothetical protein
MVISGHAQAVQLIRQKLADGRLPLQSIPRVWGSPGHGETCDACDGIIAQEELVIEGMPLAAGGPPIRLHVDCFYLCEQEQRTAPWPVGSASCPTLL